MKGKKFYACQRCWENDEKPTPEDCCCTFTRTVTRTECGSQVITFDEDGDLSEGETGDWDGDGEHEEPNDYISCDCCSHEIYTSGHYNMDNVTGIVALFQRDSDDEVFAYDAIEDTNDDDDDEDEDEDEVSVPTFTFRQRDDGRTLNVPIVVTASPPPETPEIKIVFGQ